MFNSVFLSWRGRLQRAKHVKEMMTMCDGVRDLKGLYNIDGFLNRSKLDKKLELVSRFACKNCELLN